MSENRSREVWLHVSAEQTLLAELLDWNFGKRRVKIPLPENETAADPSRLTDPAVPQKPQEHEETPAAP
jgi:hypothetical protein